jgi:hypothetical protein
MLRLVLSAVALAGVIGAAYPVSADPLTATAPDQVQAAAATNGFTSPAPVWSSSSDAAEPEASGGLRKNIAPAGFGWG